jgi:hypothetical protein
MGINIGTGINIETGIIIEGSGSGPISPPVANPVSQTIVYNSSDETVPLNITGDVTSVAVYTPATYGLAEASGITITYTPDTGYTGSDSFEYTASNPAGTSAPALVSITVSAGVVVSYLIVAGGGGGGNPGGGGLGAGGGAGGLIQTTSNVVAGSYSVVIGSGGLQNQNGQNSSFNGLTAIGGGSGSSGYGINGFNGGSGGGGYAAFFQVPSGPLTPATNGGTATSGQGNNGGKGDVVTGSNYGNGGGGGAGQAGGDAVGGSSGAGGNGIQSSISGTATYYAGGGGGCGVGDVASNGLGGGPGSYGGGGRGNKYTGYPNYDIVQPGGPGVVIISYATGSLSATGGTITNSGGNTIHTFTSNGTFEVASPYPIPSSVSGPASLIYDFSNPACYTSGSTIYDLKNSYNAIVSGTPTIDGTGGNKYITVGPTVSFAIPEVFGPTSINCSYYIISNAPTGWINPSLYTQTYHVFRSTSWQGAQFTYNGAPYIAWRSQGTGGFGSTNAVNGNPSLSGFNLIRYNINGSGTSFTSSAEFGGQVPSISSGNGSTQPQDFTSAATMGGDPTSGLQIKMILLYSTADDPGISVVYNGLKTRFGL